jgi:hypothetical protein
MTSNTIVSDVVLNPHVGHELGDFKKLEGK